MSNALYHKYRPQNLTEIVGQETVVTTLSNALKLNEVNHAYLFAGTRGTGKTSTARILAKELGIEGVDLIEIDAASHRGIDKVREIKDSVQFMPVQGSAKMYILDEVHMLTTEAFNALLKTIEEPPSYCYFVLCTTEAYKLPATIVSRCQRLFFQQASREHILEYLQRVLELEKITLANPEVLDQLVELADGSYRDALVILEGAIGYSSIIENSPIVLKLQVMGNDPGAVELMYIKLVQGELYGFLEYTKSLSENQSNLRYFLEKLTEHVTRVVVGEVVDSISRTEVLNSPIDIIEALNKIESRRIYSTNLLTPVIIEISKLKSKDINESQVKAPIDSGKDELKNNITESLSKEDTGVMTDVPTSPENSSLSQTDYLNQLIQQVKEIKPTLETLLRAVKKYEFLENGKVMLSFNYLFHKEKLEQSNNISLIEDIASKLHNQKVRIHCQIDKKATDALNSWDNLSFAEDEGYIPQEVRSEIKANNPSPKSFRREKKSDTPDLLKVAQDVFGGQLIE